MADIITVMNLGWRYEAPDMSDEPRVGLRNITCYVQQGAIVGVIGPTSAGKTTLMKALVGIIPHCTSGTLNGYVRIADMNVKSTSVSDLSLRVGYVSQHPREQITCTTVEEEIAFPLENRGVAPDEIQTRVNEVLSMLHITQLRERALTTLSAGELGRVIIGAAVAGAPDVLILDEPACYLDEQGMRDLFTMINTMRNRTHMTTVIAEQHTRMIAGHADTVFVMVNGEMIRKTSADIITRERSLLESVGVLVASEEQAPLIIEQKQIEPSSSSSIVCNHAQLQYRNSLPAQAPQLRDITFAVEQGSFVGVVGANGSGKTTLLRAIDAQIRLQQGDITVDGVSVRSHSPAHMARHIAYIDQDPDTMVMQSTVREEITWSARALGMPDSEVSARMSELVKRFDLYEIEDTPIASLSSGMRRIVILASALALQPHVLVLDEPVVGLDYRLKARFLEAVNELNARGTTVIMATHDEDVVRRYCSHALRLDAGQLVSYGRVQHGQQGYLAVPPPPRQHPAHAAKKGTSR